MPNQLDVISVLFFCKKSLLARHAFALFERTTSLVPSYLPDIITLLTLITYLVKKIADNNPLTIKTK